MTAELGQVKWRKVNEWRDGTIQRESIESHKPVFMLFQEIPG